MTEIEIRGKLSTKDFIRLFDFFQKDGKLKDHYQRLSVDISPGFNKKTRRWNNSNQTDIRIKKSNDKEKLSIKMGNFADKSREEIEVKLQPGEFLTALALFEALGFKSGMIYHWESWEFEYKDFEVKLSKHAKDYYTFEIEAEKRQNPDLLAKELNLHPYTEKEYYEAIVWQNRNIYKIYKRDIVEKMLRVLFPLDTSEKLPIRRLQGDFYTG